MSDSELNDAYRKLKSFLNAGPLEELPNFLTGVHVYIDPKVPHNLRKQVTRYVIAYNG